MNRKLTIVFFDAGGGHRSAAEALKNVLETQRRPWKVELLNLQELLDRLDLLKQVTGLRLEDGYNLILRKGWTRLTPQLLPVLQTIIRLYHGPTVKMLTQYWKRNRNDLVLSVIPHFNRALAESLRKASPSTPFVTLLTDFADYPPHFWIERESQFLICGTEKAQQQAFALGHDLNHVFLASGMVMKQKFYEAPLLDRARERRKLGLDPDTPTGIVMFGGHGSNAILKIVKELGAGKTKLQLVLVCGKNEKLLETATRMRTRVPIHAVGFTPNVNHYMALSDFFIGKPGPGSISEALQFHLPVIVECNGRTLPQERYNAEWIREKKLGIVLGSFDQINEAVELMLEPFRFAEFRQKAGSYRNRALNEIPEFLEQIMEYRGLRNGLGSPVTQPAFEQAAWAALTSSLQGSFAT